MFEPFRLNIQDLFHWKEEDFDYFVTRWTKTWEENITSKRSALVYSDSYMDSLLSLYFVVRQQDLGLQRYMLEDKAVFLSLVVFYLVEDLRLSFQTPASLEALRAFLTELQTKGLIREKDVLHTLAILHKFSEHLTPESDNVSAKDYMLVSDIIVFNNPVVVLGKACMFYFGEPNKTYFKFKKEDTDVLKPTLFFDQSFKNGLRINNKFIKQLYTANLQHLMEEQASKQLFPF